MNEAITIAIISAISAIISGIISYIAASRSYGIELEKIRLERERSAIQVASLIQDEIIEQLKYKDEELSKLRSEYESLRKRIAELECALNEATKRINHLEWVEQAYNGMQRYANTLECELAKYVTEREIARLQTDAMRTNGEK